MHKPSLYEQQQFNRAHSLTCMASPRPFPYLWHRTMAEVWADEAPKKARRQMRVLERRKLRGKN